MENRTRFEISWKQKAREGFTLGTRKLCGIARNIYQKIRKLRLITHLPACRPTKLLTDHKIKAEQAKAEAIAFLLRRTMAI